jgi:hypothetical protein
MSEEKCPVMLKKWLSDPCSQLWLNFVNSTLPLFHDAIRKAESQEVTAVESCVIPMKFKRQTEFMEGGKFYSSVSHGTSVFLRRRSFILKKSVFKCIT